MTTLSYINATYKRQSNGSYTATLSDKSIGYIVKANGVWVLQQTDLDAVQLSGDPAVSFHRTLGSAKESLELSHHKASKPEFSSREISTLDKTLVNNPIPVDYIQTWANVLGRVKANYFTLSMDSGVEFWTVNNVWKAQYSEHGDDDIVASNSKDGAIRYAMDTAELIYRSRYECYVEYGYTLIDEDVWELALTRLGMQMEGYVSFESTRPGDESVMSYFDHVIETYHPEMIETPEEVEEVVEEVEEAPKDKGYLLLDCYQVQAAYIGRSRWYKEMENAKDDATPTPPTYEVVEDSPVSSNQSLAFYGGDPAGDLYPFFDDWVETARLPYPKGAASPNPLQLTPESF